ncbi:MAG: hypothetical protein GX974_03600 [Clostridiales bacterium]|nr:hypothetical protein [Clostridiales bacterium]
MDNSVLKSDFYYGAFLSKIIDAGNKPTLIKKDRVRGIYRLNKGTENYLVYIKYATVREKHRRRWNFTYTDNDIKEIKKYSDKSENILFVFICTYRDFNNTEIGIATLEELLECIRLDCTVNKNNRTTIIKVPNSPALRMYGTKRADMINNKDNTIHLSRSRINGL